MGGLVWLASYPKSGNTWARVFLHNLMSESGEEQDINKMHTLTSTDNAAGLYEDLLPRPVEKCSSVEVARVRPKVHQKIADAYDGLVFLKSHNALVEHDGVPMITASLTAGAIYIVRDPLDIAVSYSPHLGLPIDETIALMNLVGRQTKNHPKGVYQILGSWSENVHSWTRRPNRALHIMCYEDMLAKPLETFAALAEFLTLKPTNAQLIRAIELSSFKRLQEQEKKAGFHERPAAINQFFREGRAGQWREVLSEAQVEAIVAVHRRQMERFGYLPENFKEGGKRKRRGGSRAAISPNNRR